MILHRCDRLSIYNSDPLDTHTFYIGGFARVVKAEFDGSQVALKILLPQWCDPGKWATLVGGHHPAGGSSLAAGTRLSCWLSCTFHCDLLS
jgi:hypothetical protein